MKNGDDFEPVASQPVRDEVRRARNDELTRAGHSAGATKMWEPGHAFDGGHERGGDTASRAGVLARDVRPKVSQVADRARRPDDGHARGALRSRFRPHDRSQADTSL